MDDDLLVSLPSLEAMSFNTPNRGSMALTRAALSRGLTQGAMNSAAHSRERAALSSWPKLAQSSIAETTRSGKLGCFFLDKNN